MATLTPPNFPSRFETKEKVIALTFDDGPNPPHTEKLLDILANRGVKASFFLVGNNAQKFPELVKRIASDGHTVGNHLLSHNFLTYFSEDKFAKELSQTQEILSGISGTISKFYRPPWLYRTQKQLETVKSSGMIAVGGVFGFEFEIFQPSAKIIAARAFQKSKPGQILIFHDGIEARGGNRAQTVEAVGILIDKLINLGYKFTTLDELIK